MTTAPSHRMDSFAAPMGFLDAASVATRASLSIGQLLRGQTPSSEPFSEMAVLLPRLLSAQSLANVQREYVDTSRLIAVDHAIAQLPDLPEERASVDDIVTVLSRIETDFQQLATGSCPSNERLAQLRLFCLALSENLVDQVPLPSAPADARRV